MDLNEIRTSRLSSFRIWIENACISVVKFLVGSAMPRHVGFIMDGNRRYARRLKESTIVGHRVGFESMMRVLDWCLRFGIKEVSVYAFSLDNFHRSSEEVDGLMNLALARFGDFTEHEGLIMKEGIRVRVLGRLDMLPENVRKAATKAADATRDNSNATLNICFAYSSIEEMYQASLAAVRDNREIDVDGLSEYMYLPDASSRRLDLLVRTSGETRLSDFLLWQVVRGDTSIQFIPALWPELTFVDMAKVLIRYRLSTLVSALVLLSRPFCE